VLYSADYTFLKKKLILLTARSFAWAEQQRSPNFSIVAANASSARGTGSPLIHRNWPARSTGTAQEGVCVTIHVCQEN
jgi:hypothetical protein